MRSAPDIPQHPALGLILGSGLGRYADTFRKKTVIPYDELPHFPRPGAPGHRGDLVLGEAEGIPAVALQGRVHRYEGYTMAQVAFPVRVLGSLGIRQLIVTNAAGGISPQFSPGDLMLITDHMNLMGGNPLVGINIGKGRQVFEARVAATILMIGVLIRFILGKVF